MRNLIKSVLPSLCLGIFCVGLGGCIEDLKKSDQESLSGAGVDTGRMPTCIAPSILTYSLEHDEILKYVGSTAFLNQFKHIPGVTNWQSCTFQGQPEYDRVIIDCVKPGDSETYEFRYNSEQYLGEFDVTASPCNGIKQSWYVFADGVQGSMNHIRFKIDRVTYGTVDSPNEQPVTPEISGSAEES